MFRNVSRLPDVYGQQVGDEECRHLRKNFWTGKLIEEDTLNKRFYLETINCNVISGYYGLYTFTFPRHMPGNLCPDILNNH